VIAIAFFVTRNLYHREESKKDGLRRIRERGYLVALTDRNTLNYFLYKGYPMGYQLALLESFAAHLGVPLRIIAGNNMSTLAYYLNYNAADLIALNLPVSGDGKKLVRFSDPIGETRLVLVQRKNNGSAKDGFEVISSVKDFPEDTVFVQQNAFMAQQYHAFYRKSGKHAIIKEIPDISQEELIRRVSERKIRFAVCQENVAMVYHRYYRNLDISVLAFPLFSYSWGVGHASDSLCTELNAWLKEFKASGGLQRKYLEYFSNQRIAGYMQSDYFSVRGNKISPFDATIRAQSRLVGWDWRLVASLIYQESNFQAGLVSSRSASGLMQLMPETAAKFGIDSASTPAKQITGGIKYLRFIDTQLPDEITNPIDRIYFVLASYNVGIGKVFAAREKAEKFGRDKNRWNGQVDYYLLHRSKNDPVAKADSSDGYPVDYQTEGFVDDVVGRYYHYRNLVK
jgi:membrane-bound lytic murein transglycosylase F